jgi:hypothetical protein
MTQLTQPRRRGSTPVSNRSPRRNRTDAHHTRMRVSSDSVVSAYIDEIARSARPAERVTKRGSRPADRAAGARIGRLALELA